MIGMFQHLMWIVVFNAGIKMLQISLTHYAIKTEFCIIYVNNIW